MVPVFFENENFAVHATRPRVKSCRFLDLNSQTDRQQCVHFRKSQQSAKSLHPTVLYTAAR